MSVPPRLRSFLALLPALFLAGTAMAGGPPPDVSTRLAKGLKFLDGGSLDWRFTITTHSTEGKLDGSSREETVTVQRITVLPDGRRDTELVSATKNGKDVTEEERKRLDAKAKRAEKTKRDGKGGKGGERGLKLPFEAGNEKLFTFGDPVAEGELLVQAFEPVLNHRKDDGMTRGKVAWSPDTLDPAWIEFTLSDLPSGLSEFLFRFEFGRAGGEVVLRRMVTSGVAGFLWIKRRFSAEVELSDFVRLQAPEPAATPTAPPPS